MDEGSGRRCFRDTLGQEVAEKGTQVRDSDPFNAVSVSEPLRLRPARERRPVDLFVVAPRHRYTVRFGSSPSVRGSPFPDSWTVDGGPTRTRGEDTWGVRRHVDGRVVDAPVDAGDDGAEVSRRHLRTLTVVTVAHGHTHGGGCVHTGRVWDRVLSRGHGPGHLPHGCRREGREIGH